MIPTSLRSARSIDQDRIQNLQNQTAAYVQDFVNEINTVQNRLEHSEWFCDLFIHCIAAGETLTREMRETIASNLTEYVTQSPLIKMVSFVFYDDDTMYNYLTIVKDWEKYQKYDTNASLKYRFFEQAPGAPSILNLQSYTINNIECNVLVYQSEISNLFKVTTNRPKGQINIILDDWQIRRALMALLPGESKGFRLLDAEGTELVSDVSKNISHPTVTFPMPVSDYWLEIDIEAAICTESESTMMRTITIILLIDSLVCLITILLFARINSLPLRELSTQVQGNGQFSSNEFAVIDEGIRMLKQRNTISQQELDTAKPLFRQHFLLYLLSGFEIDPDDESRMASYGIHFPYPYFRVAKVQLPLLKFSEGAADIVDESIFLKTDVTFAAMAERQQGKLPLRVYPQALDVCQFALIINYSDNRALENYLNALNNESKIFLANTRSGKSACFGIGLVTNSFEELMASMQSASAALNWQVMNENNGILWAEQMPADDQSQYQYGISEEVTLINAICNGQESTALNVLNHVLRDNMAYASTRSQNARYLYNDLLSTMHMAIHSLKISPELLEMEGANNVPDGGLSAIRSHFEEIVHKICLVAKSTTDVKEKTDGLESQIMHFVRRNLFDPMLSLSSIAEAHSISMSYVSALFKRQTGTSYSEYINMARIQEALQLMKETNLPIEEVMEQCGYVSMSTFRRNFVRYANTTPGQIPRKNISGSEPSESPDV